MQSPVLQVLVSVLNEPPLLKQSTALTQLIVSPSTVAVVFPEIQAASQAAKMSAMLDSEQLHGPSLTPQLRAAVVSWRTSCWVVPPFSLTHIASRVELALFGLVVSIFSPQTTRQPPQESRALPV